MIKKKRTMNNDKIMKKVKNLRTTIKPKQTTTKTKVVLQENHESVKDIITQGKANRGSINRSTIEEKINKKMNKLQGILRRKVSNLPERVKELTNYNLHQRNQKKVP